MNIVSYRGPSSPGGVSGTMSRIFDRFSAPGPRWWYVSRSALLSRQRTEHTPYYVCHIPQRIVEGHYRYCNEFLWPVLHDLPQFCTYSSEDKKLYEQFNLSAGCNILQSLSLHKEKTCFVNDYQFALLPGLLSGRNAHATIFWHIPWPKSVDDIHVEALTEIATGLLGASRIGFHTNEYAFNFLSFVEMNFPHLLVDFEGKLVFDKTEIGSKTKLISEIVVQPLGIDVQFWRQTAQSTSATPEQANLAGVIDRPFVLSVDRADYTKGVMQRIFAIDRYFEKNPTKIGDVTFLQICQPSRTGLAAFKKYWEECQALARQVNSRWAFDGWQPVVWIEEQVDSAALAWFYKKAAALLITPLRDGLNLTVKEFIACTDKDPGVLLLSPGAGVWHEVQEHALPVEPLQADQMAYQISQALQMSADERSLRSKRLKKCLETNTLASWYHLFGLNKDTVPTALPTKTAEANGRSRRMAL